MKQTSQSSMVEVNKSTYEEALLRQLHFILGMFLYVLCILETTQSLHRFMLFFSTFIVDLTFRKILNMRRDES